MRKAIWFVVAVAGTATVLISTGWADIPAPPVNQTIGFKDTVTEFMDAATCSGCHPGNQANKHHLLYNTALPPANQWYSSKSDPNAPDPVPYPFPNYTLFMPRYVDELPPPGSPPGTPGPLGTRDTKFSCLSCHGSEFKIPKVDPANPNSATDCTECHKRSPHHGALGEVDPAFPGRDHKCTPCHGDIVNDYNDGHYVPTYLPSLVTPRMLDGEGLPLNSRGHGAGACDYCHDSDGLPTPIIRNSHDTHHGANKKAPNLTGGFACAWCHGSPGRPNGNPTLRSPLQTISYTPGAGTFAVGDQITADPGKVGIVVLLGATAPDGTKTMGVDVASFVFAANDVIVSGTKTGTIVSVANAIEPRCESCHGPTTLHAIQADSSKTPGALVVGGEDAGYGHQGRDNGPGDSDCWGCHGFSMTAAPGTGPMIPTVYDADKTTITAGAAATVVLTGAAFTNTTGGTTYESNVVLTGPDGASVTLTPDVIVDQGSIAVTIPAGSTKPGNYRISAKKADFASNPAAISVIPKVRITTATAAADRTVTIKGAGFAGYQAGSGLFVNGVTSTGKTVKGTVVSWAPGKIVAKFGTAPTKVNVKSVFGKASHAVVAQ